jgi:hypothetical protein
VERVPPGASYRQWVLTVPLPLRLRIALDQLEPLLKIPGFLSPDWLKIDPSFDPLRKNPRFQEFVAGGKSPTLTERLATPPVPAASPRKGPTGNCVGSHFSPLSSSPVTRCRVRPVG